ncbi:MAG: GNAT family N-acetyltransferase [Bacteroidota bacterium]|nr:GNAT family N-acetyltransferase [Bacteroidota bacterium]
MNKALELFDVEEISDISALENLYNEWNSLFMQDTSATPFQSPDWIIPWWKCFGTGYLYVLCMRNEEKKLVGLAPLYIYYLKDSHLKQLTLIGTGNSDYLDIIADETCKESTAYSLFSYLKENSFKWDICYFQGLRENSQLMTSKKSCGFSYEISQLGVCPVVHLNTLYEEYLSLLPMSFKKNLIRAESNLKRSGELFLEQANEDTIDEFLFDLFFLHEKTWNKKGSNGVLSGKLIKNFHDASAKGLLKNKLLKLYRLKYNGKAVASAYLMLKDKVIYYYIGGYDPEMKKFSPGSLLILSVIKEAIENDIKYFDFLLGSENYKYNFAAADRIISRAILRKL